MGVQTPNLDKRVGGVFVRAPNEGALSLTVRSRVSESAGPSHKACVRLRLLHCKIGSAVFSQVFFLAQGVLLLALNHMGLMTALVLITNCAHA